MLPAASAAGSIAAKIDGIKKHRKTRFIARHR
jgi:hypothetical protein